MNDAPVQRGFEIRALGEVAIRCADLGPMVAFYRDVLGRHFPAMSLFVISGLLEDRAKVEIEATAVIP